MSTYHTIVMYIVFMLALMINSELLGENEIVPVKISNMVIVSKDGMGNFSSINDAIAAAPNNSRGNDGYFMIKIMEGIYQEYVVIDNNKGFVMMTGVGVNRTIITGNRSYNEGWTTMSSATFSASAPNFICMNMTIRNTAGPTKGQAVALFNSGDFSAFYKCNIEGYQDTLYVYSKRQFYRECDIYGTIDFIFGNAAVVFQKCNIYARKPSKGNGNDITAQGRDDLKDKTAIVIQGCSIRPTNDLTRSNYTVKSYLGRPWKKYSRTIIMQSYIDGFIEPAGWERFSGDIGLKTLYYAEYNNTGLGSNTNKRVTWTGYHIVNASVASKFTVSIFIKGDDWITRTNVPYVGGFI